MPLLFLSAREAAVLHLQNRSLLLLCALHRGGSPISAGPGAHGIGIATAACPATAAQPAMTFGSTQTTVATTTKISSDAEKSHDPKPQCCETTRRSPLPPRPGTGSGNARVGEPGSCSAASRCRADGGGGSSPSLPDLTAPPFRLAPTRFKWHPTHQRPPCAALSDECKPLLPPPAPLAPSSGRL